MAMAARDMVSDRILTPASKKGNTWSRGSNVVQGKIDRLQIKLAAGGLTEDVSSVAVSGVPEDASSVARSAGLVPSVEVSVVTEDVSSVARRRDTFERTENVFSVIKYSRKATWSTPRSSPGSWLCSVDTFIGACNHANVVDTTSLRMIPRGRLFPHVHVLTCSWPDDEAVRHRRQVFEVVAPQRISGSNARPRPEFFGVPDSPYHLYGRSYFGVREVLTIFTTGVISAYPNVAPRM